MALTTNDPFVELFDYMASNHDKDLLGQKGSGSEKPDSQDERDRLDQTTSDLRDAIRARGGKGR